MKTLAAILLATEKPLELAELEIGPLKPGQVLVEVAFSCVCHTQVLEVRGKRGEDRYLPHCLGHEGSGIVRDKGPGVTKVESDDRVILSWIKGSGADAGGTVYGWKGNTVNSGPITTFSRYAVVSENRLTRLPEGVSLREAAALGCAVPTGAGMVFNTAQPRPGQSVAIFGVGGVGACAIAGAVIAGCSPVIAIDVLPNKLELARRMGATETILASRADVPAEIQRICPDGLDFAIEASGRPQVMLQAVACVRSRGGVAVIAGNAHFGESVALDPRELNQGKQLRGTWGGDTEPDRDFPRYCRLIQAGRLDLAPLLTSTYSLHQINAALDDLEAGMAIRPLIDMSEA